MFSIDVANALVNLYKFWKQDRELQAWVKLILSTVYSGVIAFLGTDGALLVAHVNWTVAMGSGMIASATSITGILLRSPQGKSLMLSLPGTVVEQVQQAQGKGQVTVEPEGK